MISCVRCVIWKIGCSLETKPRAHAPWRVSCLWKQTSSSKQVDKKLKDLSWTSGCPNCFVLASEAPSEAAWTLLCMKGRTFTIAKLVRSLWTGTKTFLSNPTWLCWPLAATGVPWCSTVQDSWNRKKKDDFRQLGVPTVSSHFSGLSVWEYLNDSFPDSRIKEQSMHTEV